jgi:hypothetical protein
MARLADGFLTTQLLYVAARLGVADVLASGPRTGPEIAAAVGADPDLLTRALRGLVLDEVLAEEAGGRFALTGLGHCLRADAAGSMRGPILARGRSTTRPRPGPWPPSGTAGRPSSRCTATGSSTTCGGIPSGRRRSRPR